MIRFRRILCPVDFSPASVRAFDYALKLASNYDAAIDLLHVVSPMTPAVYGAPFEAGDLTAEMETYARKEIGKLTAKARKSGVPARAEVCLGDIAAEIDRAVRAKKSELVVMGTHGRRGFERWTLGSVTERVMRHCSVPLLTISEGKKARTAPPAIRNILVTTDFSEGSAEALNNAFSIAQECQSRITLLHVVHEPPGELAFKLHQPALESVRHKLADLIPEEARLWCEVASRVEAGVPYQVILNIVKAQKIDLLVMNIHGKGKLERALVGSTAERVVRGAGCPVLLVPPVAAVKTRTSRKRKKAA
jgi:nucleotide-binding universal stress UspA family protein